MWRGKKESQRGTEWGRARESGGGSGSDSESVNSKLKLRDAKLKLRGKRIGESAMGEEQGRERGKEERERERERERGRQAWSQAGKNDIYRQTDRQTEKGESKGTEGKGLKEGRGGGTISGRRWGLLAHQHPLAFFFVFSPVSPLSCTPSALRPSRAFVSRKLFRPSTHSCVAFFTFGCQSFQWRIQP